MQVGGFANGSASLTVPAPRTVLSPDFPVAAILIAGSKLFGFWQTTDHWTFTVCAGAGPTGAAGVGGARALPGANQFFVPLSCVPRPIPFASAPASAPPAVSAPASTTAAPARIG